MEELGVTLMEHRIIKTIPVGRKPSKIYLNEPLNRIYVLNTGSNTVTVLNGDTSKSIRTISVIYE